MSLCWRISIPKFYRFETQHMKTVAKEAGITEEIMIYRARHTFATTIMRKGTSIEMASGLLGHQSVAITKSYRAGFEDLLRRLRAICWTLINIKFNVNLCAFLRDPKAGSTSFNFSNAKV